MKLFRFTVKAAGAMLIAAGCALPVSVQAAGSVDAQQGRTMQNQGALLLDVREPAEYADGHAPGSRLIPLGQLKNRVSEIQAFKDKPVVVICRSGRRSAQAAGILSQLGFTNIHNAEGGMLAWEKAGLPVAKPK
jgi:rhodanese-related sulfurtransferase